MNESKPDKPHRTRVDANVKYAVYCIRIRVDMASIGSHKYQKCHVGTQQK